MIQEIAPHIFHNQPFTHVPGPDDRVFVCREDTLLLKVTEGEIHIPSIRELEISPQSCRTLFSQDSTWYTMLQQEGADAPEGYAYYNKHQYRECGPMEVLFPCAVAGSLNRWYRSTRYCGFCGSLMADTPGQLSRTCPSCRKKVRPKIMPAVIAGIRDGDRILLTRYHGPASKRPALVAGFNEIGESIEDTLRREVMEEVGLKVKNLRFYKSQPWVITDSLMIGFFCDLDGDSHITMEKSELSAAAWVSRRDLPPDTTHLSLTAEMIEQFRIGKA